MHPMGEIFGKTVILCAGIIGDTGLMVYAAEDEAEAASEASAEGSEDAAAEESEDAAETEDYGRRQLFAWIAYVDEDYVLHAQDTGKSKITAKVNGKTITINVTVK